MRRVVAVLAGLGMLTGMPALAGSLSIQPEVAAEGRVFFQEGQFPGQLERLQGGLILTGDLRWTSEDRDTRIRFEPYLRLDSQDAERTYADIREATISVQEGDWDVLFGVGQVFWGVAESRNVVDVINQFDTVEDFDQVEKLGQPLLRVSKRGDFGTVEVYYLPFFREQRFPGADGRLRFGVVVDADAATFERGGEEFAGDAAVRYTNRFGNVDLGLHTFYGTSRNPILLPSADGTVLTPFYPDYAQGGLDLQVTKGPWLLKLEAAGVGVGGDRFATAVAGFEYTFFDIAGSGIDVGAIGEYLHDGRDLTKTPISVFENDAFAGARIAFNDIQDTEILAGAIIDVETGGVIGSVELERRLGDRMMLEVEVRAFRGGTDPLVGAFARDSHLSVRLTRYF